MSKEDKIIEVMAWICLGCIVGFFRWINYELSLPVS
jgi:hypothetical protein